VLYLFLESRIFHSTRRHCFIDSWFNSYAFQLILIEAEQLQMLISLAEELVSEKFRELVVLR